MTEQAFATPEEALAHFGVKGMRWGVRNDKPSGGGSTVAPESKSSRNKKIAIGVGALTVVAGASYAAYTLKTQGRLPFRSAKAITSSAKGAEVTKKVLQEPTDIIHLARGKNKGLTFQKKGNTPDFFTVFDNMGLNEDKVGREFFERAKDGSGRVAARFLDPHGRRDAAGRAIAHDVVIPRSMTTGVHSVNDVKRLIYPKIKDTYDAFYQQSLERR